MKFAITKLHRKFFSYRLLFSLLILTLSQNSFADNNFLIKDTAGNKHQLSNYRGKWVLVNYWATWCPPCLEEVPDLVNLYDNLNHYDKAELNTDTVESFINFWLYNMSFMLYHVSDFQSLREALAKDNFFKQFRDAKIKAIDAATTIGRDPLSIVAMYV